MNPSLTTITNNTNNNNNNNNNEFPSIVQHQLSKSCHSGSEKFLSPKDKDLFNNSNNNNNNNNNKDTTQRTVRRPLLSTKASSLSFTSLSPRDTFTSSFGHPPSDEDEDEGEGEGREERNDATGPRPNETKPNKKRRKTEGTDLIAVGDHSPTSSLQLDPPQRRHTHYIPFTDSLHHHPHGEAETAPQETTPHRAASETAVLSPDRRSSHCPSTTELTRTPINKYNAPPRRRTSYSALSLSDEEDQEGGERVAESTATGAPPPHSKPPVKAPHRIPIAPLPPLPKLPSVHLPTSRKENNPVDDSRPDRVKYPLTLTSLSGQGVGGDPPGIGNSSFSFNNNNNNNNNSMSRDRWKGVSFAEDSDTYEKLRGLSHPSRPSHLSVSLSDPSHGEGSFVHGYNSTHLHTRHLNQTTATSTTGTTATTMTGTLHTNSVTHCGNNASNNSSSHPNHSHNNNNSNFYNNSGSNFNQSSHIPNANGSNYGTDTATGTDHGKRRRKKNKKIVPELVVPKALYYDEENLLKQEEEAHLAKKEKRSKHSPPADNSEDSQRRENEAPSDDDDDDGITRKERFLQHQHRRPALRLHLYSITILVLVVMVVVVGCISVVPLDHVSEKSIDSVSTTLSASLADNIADSIQSLVYFLPISVLTVTSSYLKDSGTRTWDWTEEDMPQAMEQLCSTVANSPSSHLLYLSFSSPISGYGAYCSAQYLDHEMVGQYTMHHQSDYRYPIDTSTFTYQAPPEPFTAVNKLSQEDYTVKFGASRNPWKNVALPWYERQSTAVQEGQEGVPLPRQDGWWVFRQNNFTVLTYSVPFIDYKGNLAMVSGAMQAEGLHTVFPDGFVSSHGRVMVVDPMSGAVIVNSWGESDRVVLDDWNYESESSKPYREMKQLHIDDVEDSVMRRAVEELGGLRGLASRPITVLRWSVKFRDDGWSALATVHRITVGEGDHPLNLLVIFAIRRSEYFDNIESTRVTVIVSIVIILIIILCLACVLIYLFLQPIHQLGRGLRDAARLQGNEDPFPRLSLISEIAEMQSHFIIMRDQLMRMKTFLPQGVLGAPSVYAESEERISSEGESSRAQDFATFTPRHYNGSSAFNSTSAASRPNRRRDSGDSQNGETVVPILSPSHSRAVGQLHLNGRALLDEVNSYRRRYCTLMALVVHVREKEITAGRFQPFTTAFLEYSIPAILQFGGVIEVQRPDYLFVSFGSHTRVAMHQNRAATCALNIISQIYSSPAASLIAHRVGCFIDVGECYVGTCGAADRNARVTYGTRLPMQADLVKLTQTLQSPILLTQRIAATLDHHLLTTPVDSLILSLHKANTILYELRGSTRALPPELPESEVRASLQCIRGAFSRMTRGDYQVALRMLEEYDQRDPQATRLAELCRTLLRSRTTKPFVRSIGRIRFNENDCLYDATDYQRLREKEAAKDQHTSVVVPQRGSHDPTTLSVHAHPSADTASLSGPSSGAPPIYCVPSSENNGTNNALLLLMDHPNKLTSYRVVGRAPHSITEETPSQQTSEENPVLEVEGDSVEGKGEESSSKANPDASDGSNSGDALFEMFIEPDEPDHFIIESSSIHSSVGSVLGGGGPITVQASMVAVEGELPLYLIDCDGGHWTRSQERLGCGATGVVYRGLSQSGSLVALKCFQLHSRDIDKSLVVEEVRLLASLHHENIVQYISVYVSEYHLVEIMELVPGGSLDSLLLNFGALSAPSVRRYLQDILNGLHYLHSMGIVHCDVKPHNVLLAMEGQCKLSDFGSALGRAATSNCDERDFLELRGTPAYMAPEVARGEVPTAKSDVFSLGVTLLELLCGELPWQYREEDHNHQVDGSERVGSPNLWGSGHSLPTVTYQSGELPPINPLEFDITTLMSPKCLKVSPENPPRRGEATASLPSPTPPCDESGEHLNHNNNNNQNPSKSNSNSNTAVFGLVPPTSFPREERPPTANTTRLPIEKLRTRPTELIIAIGRGEVIPVVPPQLSEEVREFIEACVRERPEDRPDVASLLDFDWMM